MTNRYFETLAKVKMSRNDAKRSKRHSYWHSVQNLPPRLVSRSTEVKTRKSITVPVVLCNLASRITGRTRTAVLWEQGVEENLRRLEENA
jgi:hypothetical protein